MRNNVRFKPKRLDSDFVKIFGRLYVRNLFIIFIKMLIVSTFSMCGPFAVLMSYISEFHGTNHRSRVMMVIGMFFSLATISLPAIAWFIIPKSWTFNFGNFICKYFKS